MKKQTTKQRAVEWAKVEADMTVFGTSAVRLTQGGDIKHVELNALPQEEKDLIARWPASFVHCARCRKVHETFVDCGGPLIPCEICGDKGGWEWNRHAVPPCWERAPCPLCGAEAAITARPPAEPLL